MVIKMKINVTGFMRSTLKNRIASAKKAVAVKLKKIAAMEKELAKLENK